MKIEDHWNDVFIYYVSFETNQHQIIRRVVVLKDKTEKDEIEKIVYSNFSNVCAVKHIDEWDEALLLKD